MFSACEGLEELFVCGTMAIVDYKTEMLCAPKGGLPRGANVAWGTFDSYSLANGQANVQATAPVSWAIASTLAFNRDLDALPAGLEASATPPEVPSNDEGSKSE